MSRTACRMLGFPSPPPATRMGRDSTPDAGSLDFITEREQPGQCGQRIGSDDQGVVRISCGQLNEQEPEEIQSIDLLQMLKVLYQLQEELIDTLISKMSKS